MALPGLFPIYPDPVPMKYQVSLALPPLPISEINKSIGVTSSTSFLIPNIDYLKSFAEGNIGISDKIAKETLYKNLNSPYSQSNERVFKGYAKLNNIDIQDTNKYKKDGKIKFPKEEVTNPSVEGLGLSAFEKTILTSIFETQKPYLEIAKLVIGNVAKIEDIIARVMPLLGIPLKTKSLKPVGNKGVPNGRPKAIGYQNGAELKKAISKLQTLTNTGSKINIDKNGNAIRETIQSGTSSVSGSLGSGSINNSDSRWEVLSTVYSTGVFIPSVQYKYTYIDLPEQKAKPEETAELNLEDDDPYNKYKPERIILGIFRSDGTPLNPNEYLQTIDSTNGSISYKDTQFKRADWLLRSAKWRFPEGVYSWPASGSPIYKWIKGLSSQDSKVSPGDGWEVKKYKKNDKDLLTGDDAIEGDPVVVGFDSTQVNEYSSYFTDIVRYKISQVEDADQNEKSQYVKDIVGRLNIPSHLRNVNAYSPNKTSVYKPVDGKPAFPDKMRIPFKPFQIYSANAERDENLSAYNRANGQRPGLIWIDPESDYETKVIRVDPTTNIAFEEAKGQPQISSKIKSFVKNKVTFSISNGQNFNIEISKNGLPSQTYTNINQYVLENWNYNSSEGLPPERRLENNNTYSLTIWSDLPTKDYANIFGKSLNSTSGNYEIVKQNGKWIYKKYTVNTTINQYGSVVNTRVYENIPNGVITLNDSKKTRVMIENGFITRWYYIYNKVFDASNLPSFGKDRKIVLNYSNDLDSNSDLRTSSSDINIPLYQIKVENTNFPYGKIIDPSKITNENLSKDELYSTNKYGSGDDENPQSIEVIKRYMLTDLDTESYYIIEGVLIDKNKQTDDVPNRGNGASSGSGSGYYRLPHAFGATKIFALFVADIVSKLIPKITKLIALFKNPASFVIEVIKEKLGDGFSIFSKESFSTFEKAKSIKGEKSRPSDKSNRLKDLFKNSPLSNTVYVNKKGDYKFLLDGIAMLPFTIFGLNIPFGADLNFSNLPSPPIKLIKDAKSSKVQNMQDFLMPKIKDYKGPGSDGLAPNSSGKLTPGFNISDIKSMESPIYKENKDFKKNQNDSGYEIIDIKYSTGSFINGVNYNYIYIDQETNKLLKDANDLLNTPNESLDFDSEKAKKVVEDLNDELKKDPSNQALKDILNKLKQKLGNLADKTQPLIKMLLGIVTIPIKIIGGIIEWLMKFFKGLANPLTLPSKIVELLSFSWVMDLVSPIGMLKLVGIKFKPEKLAEWFALSKIPNAKPPSKTPKTPSGTELKGLKYYKDASPKGRFLIPDDYDLADLNEFFSAPFMPKLPTYTARQFRNNPTAPLKVIMPLLCFFEKIINGIIDFIWAVLGIEALIPPPHIKWCSGSANPSIEDAIKLANDMNKTSNQPVNTGGPGKGLINDGNNGSISSDADFLYDITLQDGTVVKGLNYEQMQNYIKEHENIGYDFKF